MDTEYTFTLPIIFLFFLTKLYQNDDQNVVLDVINIIIEKLI